MTDSEVIDKDKINIHLYSNNILVEPLKNRQAGTIKTAWALTNETFSNTGVMTKIYILDNEA